MPSPLMKAPPVDERQRPSFEASSAAFPERAWEQIDPIDHPDASIASLAEERLVDPEVLMQFNFGTRDPEEVNWWLGELGCTEVTESGNNYTFAGWSGVFWAPVAQSLGSGEPLFDGASTDEAGLTRSVTLPIKLARPASGPPLEYGHLAARFELAGSLKLTIPASHGPEVAAGVTKLSVQTEVSHKLIADVEGGLSTKWEAMDLVGAVKDMAGTYADMLADGARRSDVAANKANLRRTVVSTLVPEIEGTIKSQFDDVFGTDADVELQAGLNITEPSTPFSVQVAVKGGDTVLVALQDLLPEALTSLAGLKANLSVTFTIKVGPSTKVLVDLGNRLGVALTGLTALELGAAVATVGVVYGLVGFAAWANSELAEHLNDELVFSYYKASYVATVLGAPRTELVGPGDDQDERIRQVHAIDAGRLDARADADRFFGPSEDVLAAYRTWLRVGHDRMAAKSMLFYILDKRREQAMTGVITADGPGAAAYRTFLHENRNGWLPAELFDNAEAADQAMADNFRQRYVTP